MWPFKKKDKIEYLDPRELNYTQLDITERFDDSSSLAIDEWIETVPINRFITDGNLGNLPPVDASEDDVFQVASELSEIRELFKIPGDGVYCPICHVANIDVSNLRTACPGCSRPLLAFGWT